MNKDAEELKNKLKKIMDSGSYEITDELISELEESFLKITEGNIILSDPKIRDIFIELMKNVQEYERNKNQETLKKVYNLISGLRDQL